MFKLCSFKIHAKPGSQDELGTKKLFPCLPYKPQTLTCHVGKPFSTEMKK